MEMPGNSFVAQLVISDEARRASDIINLHRTVRNWDELKNKWIAIKLSDGDSDGVLYDSKRDAVRHQLHEYQCAYICFRNLVGGATPREMQFFLDHNRRLYDHGFRLPDPDSVTGGPDVLMSSGRRDYERHRYGI